VFPGRLPPLKTADIKKMLAPVLDFNVQSAATQYFETLPRPSRRRSRRRRPWKA